MKRIISFVLCLSQFTAFSNAFQIHFPISSVGGAAKGTIVTLLDNSGWNPLPRPETMVVEGFVLAASGGEPFSGYTWTLSTGSTFPPGTTIEA